MADTNFLLKLGKLIPLLGSDNEREQLATLAAIQRLLRANEMSYTDVGQQLIAFTKDVLGAPELEAPPPPPPSSHPEQKSGGWNTKSSSGHYAPGAGPAGFGNPNGPHTRPRPQSPPPYAPTTRHFSTWWDAYSVIGTAFVNQAQHKVGPFRNFGSQMLAQINFIEAAIKDCNAKMAVVGQVPTPLRKPLNAAISSVEVHTDMGQLPPYNELRKFSVAIGNAQIYPNGIDLLV